MKHLTTRHVALSVLLVVMLLGGSASGIEIIFPSVDWTSVSLSASDVIDEDSAVIDGYLVAYEYGDQIRVKNLATDVVRTIPDPGGVQADPDVSGSRVVYQDNGSGNWDIKVYDWSTNTSSDVRATTADEILPKIDGNFIAWWDDTNDDVWARAYGLGGYTAEQITVGYSEALYDVDNGRLALVVSGGSLYVRDLLPVGDWTMLEDFADVVESIELHGNRIAVGTYNDAATDYDVVVCDITDGSIANVAVSDVLRERHPSIFHDGVAWYEYEDALIGSDIGYGFPMLSLLQTPSFGSQIYDRYPSIFGNRIVFQGSPLMGDSDVLVATSDTKLQSRSSGANRYATAAAASSAYFKSADHVVLCNGRNFPDALSAAPLAKVLNAPLLLTEANALPPETATEIARLAPGKIWVIGGTSVVSAAVYTQLDATYDIERISGANRYETSAAVARRYEEIAGADAVFKAFFAYGEDYPDALSVGPVAGAAKGPVMLVQKDAVPPSIADAVDDLNITIGYIVGGTGVVSASTDTALRALITGNGAVGTITERWFGANRYETAVAVASKGLENRWIDLDSCGFATGTDFPDALGGGAALGSYGSALLLTSGSSLSPATSNFLDSHRYQVGRVNVFGGTGVVSDAVYTAIMAKVP